MKKIKTHHYHTPRLSSGGGRGVSIEVTTQTMSEQNFHLKVNHALRNLSCHRVKWKTDKLFISDVLLLFEAMGGLQQTHVAAVNWRAMAQTTSWQHFHKKVENW